MKMHPDRPTQETDMRHVALAMLLLVALSACGGGNENADNPVRGVEPVVCDHSAGRCT
jgi:hypothetical protein